MGKFESFMAIKEFTADCGHIVVPGEIYWSNGIGNRYICDECHTRKED